jgi:hypothetical protein
VNNLLNLGVEALLGIYYAGGVGYGLVSLLFAFLLIRALRDGGSAEQVSVALKPKDTAAELVRLETPQF